MRLLITATSMLAAVCAMAYSETADSAPLFSEDVRTIWIGDWETDNWGGMQDLAWGGHDWSSFKEGDRIVFTVEGLTSAPSSVSLSNPAATRQALNVYNYLESVYGEKILSGAMAQVDWNTKNADAVAAAFGKYPAMAFFDYLHLSSSPSNWINYGDIKPVADYWNAGGIVGACWHWNVPVREGESRRTASASETTFSVVNALTSGTWEHKVLIEDLDKMASYLLLLQEKDIPLIWRPLHEAAGNIYEYQGGEAWFWWGSDGAEPFKQLWRFMYDYFTGKGVNNLIWVWTSQLKDRDFYPGAEYVDIIGRDIYNVSDASVMADNFQTISNQYDGKMVALTENGNVADVSRQWNAGAEWGWFMPWYGNQPALSDNIHADYAWWQDAMSFPQTVTRDMLPDFNAPLSTDANTVCDAVLKPSDSSWTELSCGFIPLKPGEQTVTITPSATDIARLKDNGLVVSGNNIRLTKVAVAGGGASSGIESAVHQDSCGTVIYDFLGRRLSQAKGLVIVNGRKVWVR